MEKCSCRDPQCFYKKAEKERAWNCVPSGRRILYVSYDYEQENSGVWSGGVEKQQL